MIPVVWLNLREEGVINRGFWDQAILEDLFAGELGDVPEVEHRDTLPNEGGAVVVLPARHHVEQVHELNDLIQGLDWLILILTGDEEGVFPWGEVKHPNKKLWVQTPYSTIHEGVDRRLGDGYPPKCREILREIGPQERKYDWFFAGQVRDNSRRQECVRVLQKHSLNGYLLETDGFGQGMDYREYLSIMAQSKIVVCPSGFFSPDTFRVFEALEAGCVPIVENRSHFHPDLGYWRFLFGEFPFPAVDSWFQFSRVRNQILSGWDIIQPHTQAWWKEYKASMAQWLREDLEALRGS